LIDIISKKIIALYFSSEEVERFVFAIWPDCIKLSEHFMEGKWEILSGVLKAAYPYRVNEVNAMKRRLNAENNKLSVRTSDKYRIWVLAIKLKNDFTCQKCGTHENLDSHHIISIRDNPDIATKITNGITLCEECHRWFHKKYGYSGFGEREIISFIEG